MIQRNKTIVFSFIIPAYNCEKTLRDCIESIEEDISKLNIICELVIVENGSTDKSFLIAQNLKLKYKNIQLLRSKKGVSNARNTGILAANGKYIIFIDSDDIWLKGSLQTINNDITHYDIDIIVYGFIKGKRRQEINKCHSIMHNYSLNKYADSNNNLEQMKVWLISDPTHRMQAWAKVYRCSWLLENEIFFNAELRYSEDSEFFLRGLLKANKILISDKVIMQYVISSDSVMHSMDSERTTQYIASLKYSMQEIKNTNENILRAFNFYILIHLNLILVHDIYEVRNNISWKNRQSELNTLLKENIFRNALKYVKIRDCNRIQLIPELFLKLNLKNCTGILCYIKSWLNNRSVEKR